MADLYGHLHGGGMRQAMVTGWNLLKATGIKWLDDKAPRLGAAVAFYSMLSLGPLLLLFLSIAAPVYGPEAARGQLLGQIDGLIGTEGARAIQDMLASADAEDNGIIASLIGIVTLLIGASAVFGELQDALNGIWRVESSKSSGFLNFIRLRFLSFSMVLGSGFLLLVSLVLSTVLAAWGDMNAGFMPGDELLLGIINGVISFGVVTVLFAGIFKYMPDIPIRWNDVWAGAALTALLFTLGKFAIGFYLGHSALSSTYGAGGSLVVLLVWVYYSAQILFFGAEFTYVHAAQRTRALHKNKSK